MAGTNSIWFTPQQIAEAIDVHVETVRRWLRSGIIKGIKLNKGPRTGWLVHCDEFEKFLTNCVQPISETDSLS